MRSLTLGEKIVRNALKKAHLDGIFYNIMKLRSDKLDGNAENERHLLNEYWEKPKSTALYKNMIIGQEIDLQIIIPAYNVEEYIKECIDSILEQKTKYTYKVIIVDDGSTDKTLEIVNEYVENESIEIIRQKNGGSSSARNAALKNIIAKYIMFLDADDKLAQASIEKLLNTAYENQADIVEGSYYRFSDEGREMGGQHEDYIGEYRFGKLFGFTAMKIFKADLFENVHFPEGYWFEDSIMSYLIYPSCTKIATIKEYIYYYRKNLASVSYTSRNNPKSVDTYWILEQMLKDAQAFGIELNQMIYDQTLHQIQINYQRTRYLDKQLKKSIFILSTDIINKYFKGFSTNQRRFKDLEKALKEKDYWKYAIFCDYR